MTQALTEIKGAAQTINGVLTQIRAHWRDTDSIVMREVYTNWSEQLEYAGRFLVVAASVLPTPVAGTPEQIKAALREGQPDPVSVSVAAPVPYAPLTPDEVHALVQMAWGHAPALRDISPITAVCCVLLELVAKGERPVDPATLPTWDAEEQLQWLALTSHHVSGQQGNYICLKRNSEGGTLVASLNSCHDAPGDAVNTAMRAAFNNWQHSVHVVYHSPLDKGGYCAYLTGDVMADATHVYPTQQAAAMALWATTWGQP